VSSSWGRNHKLGDSGWVRDRDEGPQPNATTSREGSCEIVHGLLDNGMVGHGSELVAVLEGNGCSRRWHRSLLWHDERKDGWQGEGDWYRRSGVCRKDLNLRPRVGPERNRNFEGRWVKSHDEG
jgi:hypothetical protein